MKISLVSSLFACAVLVACSGVDPADADPTADESSVVGGAPDHHPAVVAIDVDGDGLCTGTLVAPDVVLTARHCVSVTREQVTCGASDVSGDRDPRSLVVYGGDSIRTATPLARGRELVVPAGRALCEHDVAAIVLDRAVKGVTPADVAGAAPRVGESLLVVGFGRSAQTSGAGTKRHRLVRVREVSARELEVGESTCPGDSGGPAFDAKGAVAAVVSRGRARCAGPSASNVLTRADVVRSLVDRAKRR